MRNSETTKKYDGAGSLKESARSAALKRCLKELFDMAGRSGASNRHDVAFDDPDENTNAIMEYIDHVESGISLIESGKNAQILHAQAMARMGYYAVCECCNKEIPVERMEALPYATNCTGCASCNEAENGVNYAKRGREHEAGWSNYPDSGDEPSGCLDKVKKERR